MTTVARFFSNLLLLPLVAALLLLEPIVVFICGLGFFGGLIASVLFEISAAGPKFPFLQMSAISLSFGVVLFLYYAVLCLIVKD